MSFFNNQKISNLQWIDQSPDQLIYRFPNADQALQNRSTVILAPGQGFLFVNEGKPQGVIIEPGSYDLQTSNLPFITSMLSIFRGFDSKHKAKVFFFNLTDITNVGWGTPSPLKYVDPVYKFPVGLRAFGNYTFQISDPSKFFTEFVGDRDSLGLDEFKQTINGRIITPITNALATAGFGFTEIDSHKQELTASVGTSIAGEFTSFGFVMKDFRIENTDFDEETQRRVGSIADVQAQADAINSLSSVDAASMATYAQLQQLEALKSAASNPNGLASAGVGLGTGVGLGSAMVNNLTQPPVAPVVPPAAPQTPPSPPATPPETPSQPGQ
jgi:membrane protease subunit (stomatin/prohibitin family)